MGDIEEPVVNPESEVPAANSKTLEETQLDCYEVCPRVALCFQSIYVLFDVVYCLLYMDDVFIYLYILCVFFDLTLYII